MPQPQLRELLPVGQIPECSPRTAKAVQQGLRLSIRRQVAQQGPLAMTCLGDELAYCAQHYSGAHDVPDELMDEALEFVSTRFGGIGVDEIREAFRLAAAGDLGELNMKAYYGHFTIVILGTVLHAYLDYRSRVVQALARKEREQQIEEAQQRARDYWSTAEGLAEQQVWIDARIAALSGRELTVDDVTVYDYRILEQRGVISLSAPEKWALVAQGREMLEALHRKAMAVAATSKQRREADEILRDIEGKSKLMAQRIAVKNWAAKAAHPFGTS